MQCTCRRTLCRTLLFANHCNVLPPGWSLYQQNRVVCRQRTAKTGTTLHNVHQSHTSLCQLTHLLLPLAVLAVALLAHLPALAHLLLRQPLRSWLPQPGRTGTQLPVWPQCGPGKPAGGPPAAAYSKIAQHTGKGFADATCTNLLPHHLGRSVQSC